jgi:hypothetical protein
VVLTPEPEPVLASEPIDDEPEPIEDESGPEPIVESDDVDDVEAAITGRAIAAAISAVQSNLFIKPP